VNDANSHQCDPFEAAVWNCFRAAVPASFQGHGLSAAPPWTLLCVHQLLQPSDYRPVAQMEDLGVEPGLSYLVDFLRPGYAPSRPARYSAWRSSWLEIPDVVRIDYIAEGLGLTVLLSESAGVVLLARESLPVLELPGADRREAVANAITRLMNPGYFLGWLGVALKPPYCELPPKVEEGMYIGSAGMRGFDDPYFSAGVKQGRLFLGFVKRAPGGYGKRDVYQESPRPNAWLRRPSP
jgi:hypothetical protein